MQTSLGQKVYKIWIMPFPRFIDSKADVRDLLLVFPKARSTEEEDLYRDKNVVREGCENTQ